ncbi:MAG: 50S ribosomal protein L9 [Spirochaetaceae bacterium]|jgi:large subunit ribosomal protein L9|nr:50S ribosomal protein L9 [Spirochaetaceae bacterium]
MKVILDKDLAPLGEEGDVKEVAKGYARNYLFPRGIALPYNEKTVKLFEARKDAIEMRKQQKRQDAAGLKEKLEALTLGLTMPAGANGKLYGSVTAQTLAEELVRQGFQIERKRIEIPGNTIKSVGKFKVSVKLYESAAAECTVLVEGQELKTETRTSGVPPRGRRHSAPGGDSVADASGVVSAVPGGASAADAAVSTETSAAPDGVSAGTPVGEETIPAETSPKEAAPETGETSER